VTQRTAEILNAIFTYFYNLQRDSSAMLLIDISSL